MTAVPVGALPMTNPAHRGVGAALGEVGALTGRRFRHMAGAPGRLIGVVLNPLVMLLVIGYLFAGAIQRPAGVPDYLSFVVPGVALQVGLASLGPTAITMCSDLDSGAMDRFRSLPIRRASVVAAHLIADTALGALVLAVVLGVAALLGWSPAGGPVAVLLALVVTMLFIALTVALGMLLGTVMRRPESIDSVGALVLVIFSFLSSLLISPEMMRPWVGAISRLNPITLVVEAVRGLVGGDPAAIGAAGGVVAVLIGLTVAAVVALSAMLARPARSR